jgi:tetratricopeptide (TPR) repeat protein
MHQSASPPTLSSEEQEQLQQTIEMFEVIVQASPQDTQSLEILKDAYQRLGRSEGAAISRRLADTYRDLGQFSQAMLEYEAILQQDQNNMEVIAAIGEVEQLLEKAGKSKPSANGSSSAPGGAIKLDFSGAPANGELGTLMTTNQTQHANGSSAVREGSINSGNEALAKFLVQNRIVPEDIVVSAIDRIVKKNEARKPGTIGSSLIDEICRRGSIEVETVLSGMLDRSKFAYIPLEYYEVDRAIVKMLPEEITLSRLIVPFDVMSRTLMVAMANPFDGDGKQTVQQLLDYNIQWHLASPAAIHRVLAETYRLPTAMDAGLRLA